MAFLIDTIDSSGIFAQSANSATIATKDSNGNDITATYQSVGDYYSASNPSGFITGVDLTPYQKIEDMSAYQPSGDYYSASNPSGFITDVPAGTLNESAFEFDNGLISAYNGSAFKAGDELPSGVMNTSALEFDGSDISGYDGSAFKDVALGNVISTNSGAWGGSTIGLSAGDGIDINLDGQDVIISSTYGADISALTAQSADWNEVSSKQDTLTFNYDNDNAISAINGSALAGGASYTGDVQGALDEVYNNSANYLKDTDLDIKTFEGIVSGVNAISGEQILPSALAPNTIQLSTGNGGSEFRFMPTASPWTTADAATGIFRPLMYATGACLTMSSGPFFKGYFKGNEWFVSNTAIGQAVRGEVQATRGARIWGAEVTGSTSAEFILSAKAGDAGLCLSNPTTSVEFGINSIVNIQTNSATWNEASAVSGITADITAISAEIGDVETLLASL